MAEVTQGYIDSLKNYSLGNPDDLRYAVGMDFVGELKGYASLNIPNADQADFCIQPAGVWADVHIDLKSSLAWIRKHKEEDRPTGKKAWYAFPNTPGNERIWFEMHKNSYDYLFLSGSAMEKMEGGRYCIQYAGDLVFIPVGWFHFVITLQPSILVGSWLDGDGYEMLSCLYVYMRASRIRHRGLNEQQSKGWIVKESTHFEGGMKILLADIKSLTRTGTVSVNKVVDIFEKIWSFVEFNEEDNDKSTEVRRKWFLGVVWSNDWRDATKSLKEMYGKDLWTNSCFFSGCKDRGGNKKRSDRIKDIMTHMKKHLNADGKEI
jgi:hypothetical protein